MRVCLRPSLSPPAVEYIADDDIFAGTAFVPFRINSHSALTAYLQGLGITDSDTIHELLTLYTNDPPNDVPLSHPAAFSSDIGTQFKRAATIATDVAFTAPRRLVVQAWAKKTAPLYSYRFNTISAGIHSYYAATHFQEIAFVMDNIHGYGYPGTSQPYGGPNPFRGKSSNYTALATSMSRAWASFISDGVPTVSVGSWPACGAKCSNYVFDADAGSHTESDTFRQGGVNYLMGLYKQGQGPWGGHTD